MTERKKKCSMKQMELDMLNSEKSVNMIKGTLYAQSSSKIPTRKQSDKFSFFGTVKPKVLTGFFGSSKKAWIDDRPAPESLSEYYEQRKKIIFGVLNINDNQQEILKLILISQKKANDLIKGQTGFFFSPYQIHEWVIALKENSLEFLGKYFITPSAGTFKYLHLSLNISSSSFLSKTISDSSAFLIIIICAIPSIKTTGNVSPS